MTEQAAEKAAAPSRFVVRAALRTHVGLVRSENQDFGTYTTADEERGSMPRGRLMIVADGMGGHRGGATASRIAGETVKAQYLGSETADIPAVLRDALSRANARIFSEAQLNPELRGMGTTTSALAIRDHKGWFAHVGDSRIYRARGDAIEQLTDDHSLVASMVREGLLTSKEAENHPRRNVLQRSMGVSEDVEIDVSEPIELQEGDTFILCSDGLHGVVREEELQEVAKMDVDDAAEEFIKRALARGAPDNVTVIVARIEVGEGAEEPVPDRFEDTQPLDDTLPYDETVRDTQPLAIVTDEAVSAMPQPAPEPAVVAEEPAPAPAAAAPAAEPAAEPVSIAEPATPAATAPASDAPATTAPAAAVPAATAPPRRRSVFGWVLAILVLGAAGVWYYWKHS